MAQVIISNMQVCTGPSLAEPGAVLHLVGVGDTGWQAP